MTTEADTLLDQFLGFAARGHHQGILNMLAQHPELARTAVTDANAAQVKGTTALHLAAHKGDTKIIAILLKAGADIEARNVVGETPLIDAAGAGRATAVQLLLDNGANADAATPQGFTPLMGAARQGCDACVDALLAAGAIAASTTQNLQNALHFAAETGGGDEGLAIARALVAAGTLYDARDDFGDTPHDIAHQYNSAFATQLRGVIDEERRRLAELQRLRGVSAEFNKLEKGAGAPMTAPRTAKFRRPAP